MDSKKYLIVGGGILGFLVILLLVMWIISLSKPHYVTYEKLESKMVESAKKYYSKYNELLPELGKENHLFYDALVKEEFLKPLNEELKDGDICSAFVVVENNNSNYIYTPYLDCGVNYKTTELYKIILENNKVVETGSGLYSDNDGNYYFKGEVNNNYIKLGSTLYYSDKVDNIFRIMSVESDGTIKIRAISKTSELYTWDDRYNETQKTDYGYNKFEVSRVKDTLISFEKSNTIIEEYYRNKLVPKKLCIGARSASDETKNGEAECSIMSNDEYLFGLITPYEYMRASIDENCVNTISESCSNYNYLSNNQTNNWTLTADSNTDYKVWTFNGKSFYLSSAYNERSLNITAYLSNKAFFQSGTGTYSDPYIIK